MTNINTYKYNEIQIVWLYIQREIMFLKIRIIVNTVCLLHDIAYISDNI